MRQMALRLALGIVIGAAALAGVAASGQTVQPQPAAPARIDFNWHIRPLLSDRCFRCHGPDASKRKKKLRLDTREGAVKDIGDGWWIIKPGDPSSSELIRRINSDFEETVPVIRSNVEKLGFRFADIKILLGSHAHGDHVAGGLGERHVQ